MNVLTAQSIPHVIGAAILRDEACGCHGNVPEMPARFVTCHQWGDADWAFASRHVDVRDNGGVLLCFFCAPSCRLFPAPMIRAPSQERKSIFQTEEDKMTGVSETEVK